MYDEIFDRLSKSDFRKKFKLSPKDRLYLEQKGFDTIRSHAVDLLKKNCSSGYPK